VSPCMKARWTFGDVATALAFLRGPSRPRTYFLLAALMVVKRCRSALSRALRAASPPTSQTVTASGRASRISPVASRRPPPRKRPISCPRCARSRRRDQRADRRRGLSEERRVPAAQRPAPSSPVQVEVRGDDPSPCRVQAAGRVHARGRRVRPPASACGRGCGRGPAPSPSPWASSGSRAS
jgi:hypothetical protein